MKKMCAYVLAFILALGVCGLSAPASDAGPIVILCTNDIHSSLAQTRSEDGTVTQLGLAGVSAYRKEIEAQYGARRVTLADAGDALQGEALGTLSKGAYPLELMNLAGYELAVPGNHEFDYGMEAFFSLTEAADFPYICCNFLDKSGKTVFQPYFMADYGDIQVAYVGIATPESFTKSTPTHFQDESGAYIYSFCEGDGQLYDVVQETAEAARSEGADYVIAIAHLGRGGTTEQWRSDTLIANTTGIDALLDAHSHEQYVEKVPNRDGEEVLLLQTGTKLESLGKVVIDPDSGKLDGELISGYEGSDPEVEQRLREIEAEFKTLLQDEIARINVTLTALDPDTGAQIVRSAETNLGDLCADAYRTALNADVAFVNGGNLRADIPAGTVTYEQLLNMHPFGNQLCVAEVTGQQILDALELGASLYPQESGGFLQVSGLTYAIDPTVPSGVVLDEQGGFIRVDGQRRVYDVKVGTQAIEPERTYRLATHDYMLKDHGDGYTMFDSNMVVEDDVTLDVEAVRAYIEANLDGAEGSRYADSNGQGRITIAARPAEDEETHENTQVTYTVRRGDSLWRIAREQLGAGPRWVEIYRLNEAQISDPDKIYIGQKLILPAA